MKKHGKHFIHALVFNSLIIISASASAGQLRERINQTRQYIGHVPKSYRPNLPIPMVLSPHGGGGDMTRQANDAVYHLISNSEQAGFIIVFPNGYSRFSSGKMPHGTQAFVAPKRVTHKVMMLALLKNCG